MIYGVWQEATVLQKYNVNMLNMFKITKSGLMVPDNLEYGLLPIKTSLLPFHGYHIFFKISSCLKKNYSEFQISDVHLQFSQFEKV